MNGKSCGEAWDAVSRYVYTALQGGSIMKEWTNDDRVMIAGKVFFGKFRKYDIMRPAGGTFFQSPPSQGGSGHELFR